MNYYVVRKSENSELYHYGVPGMKWGVRKKYETVGDDDLRAKKEAYKSAKRDYNRSFNKAYNRASAAYSPIKKHRENNDKRWEDAVDKAKSLDKAKGEYKQAKKVYKEVNKEAIAARRKTAIKVGTAAVGTALAVYGAYKVNQYVKSKNGQIAAKRGYEAAEKIFTQRERSAMAKAALPGSTRTVTLNSGSGSAARSAANRAQQDSFRKAAANVIIYRRENGKYSLKYLPTIGSYGPGSSVTFTQRG